MNITDLGAEIESHGIAAVPYEEAFTDFTSRVEKVINASTYGDWGESVRIRQYSLVLRQLLLHRALKLLEGAIHALVHNNGYVMVLAVRGHFETTASIGYLHHRLASLKQGNLESSTVDRDIVAQILGTKDKALLNLRTDSERIEAKQVLTMLEYADKSVSRHIMEGSNNEHVILMDVYKWLCEFSHPNFHSHTLAFIVNKEKEEFVFNYNTKLVGREAKIIDQILISCTVFIELYDRIEGLLPAK